MFFTGILSSGEFLQLVLDEAFGCRLVLLVDQIPFLTETGFVLACDKCCASAWLMRDVELVRLPW
jgi:hypothetical protein